MSTWLFIFGRTPELSLHELSAVINAPTVRLAVDVVRAQGSLSPGELIKRLGGTVKICRELDTISAINVEALLPLLNTHGRHLTYGISGHGGLSIDTKLLRMIKEGLEQLGVVARYVTPKEGNALSSVVVAKQRVTELVIVPVDEGFTIGETIAVQDFEEWNRRDYGRPYADPKAGMLPPKVARIAVNLAMRDIPASEPGSSPVLLDPFCGMGTILGEALLTGWSVYGSDQSADAVEKARKNLAWLAGEGSYRLFMSDATHVSEHLPAHSVDAVVTEPFLGEAKRVKSQESRVSTEDIKNTIKGLEKLYIGCLRDWHSILKPHGKIVIVLPQYAVGDRAYFVKNVIDRCENLDYTITLGPLSYSRPQAIVRRMFYVLKKNKPINKLDI